MYTSCPECGTVFRISTTDLRVAEGQVRCGHCSATFNAIATLSDTPPPSATPVAPLAPDAPMPPEVGEEATLADDTLEFDIPEDNWSRFFDDDKLSRADPDPVITDLATRPAGEATAPPDPGGLEVDDNDWQALLAELPDDDATDSVYIIETDASDGAQDPTMLDPTMVDPPVPDVTPWEEAAVSEAVPVAPLPADFAADWPADDLPANAPPEDPATAQALAEDRPFVWTPPVPEAPAPRRRHGLYAAGSAVLAVALMIQVIHQRRDELATNPAFTAILQRAYGQLRLPLWPAWNLGAYEVRNYEAVADRSSRGALDILARIAVVGTESVGLPLVRVTLSDRFGQSLGSRVFGPDEYLGDNQRPREPLSPGTLIPVAISLNDPGSDAQGFDVDVCLMNQRSGLTCQSEREPFAR